MLNRLFFLILTFSFGLSCFSQSSVKYKTYKEFVVVNDTFPANTEIEFLSKSIRIGKLKFKSSSEIPTTSEMIWTFSSDWSKETKVIINFNSGNIKIIDNVNKQIIGEIHTINLSYSLERQNRIQEFESRYAQIISEVSNDLTGLKLCIDQLDKLYWEIQSANKTTEFRDIDENLTFNKIIGEQHDDLLIKQIEILVDLQLKVNPVWEIYENPELLDKSFGFPEKFILDETRIFLERHTEFYKKWFKSSGGYSTQRYFRHLFAIKVLDNPMISDEIDYNSLYNRLCFITEQCHSFDLDCNSTSYLSLKRKFLDNWSYILTQEYNKLSNNIDSINKKELIEDLNRVYWIYWRDVDRSKEIYDAYKATSAIIDGKYITVEDPDTLLNYRKFECLASKLIFEGLFLSKDIVETLREETMDRGGYMNWADNYTYFLKISELGVVKIDSLPETVGSFQTTKISQLNGLLSHEIRDLRIPIKVECSFDLDFDMFIVKMNVDSHGKINLTEPPFEVNDEIIAKIKETGSFSKGIHYVFYIKANMYDELNCDQQYHSWFFR